MNVETSVSRRVLALLSASLAVAVYLNSLANGFALDDVSIVQLNERVHDVRALRDIWLTPYWPVDGRELGLYRPATIFLFALQWAAGNGEAWVFHAVTTGMHAAVTILVFVLLDRLAGRTGAFAGALVFAVHPVHTEAVANIVGQAEVAGALTVLAACVLHVTRPAGAAVSWPRRLLLVLLFAWALSTKESTVVLPALLIITDFASARVRLTLRGFAEYADAMLMPLLLLTATLAAYLLLRFDVMGGSVIGVDAAPAMPYLRGEHRVLNALRAFPELLRLLFFPWDLAADYLPGILLPVETVRPMVLLGAALLLAISLLALLTPWRPAAGFPAAWFLISIVTVSNLFFPVGVLVAERTLYLPSVAICALVAYGWRSAARAGAPWLQKALPFALLGVLLAFGGRTWARNPDWKDTLAVLNAFVRDHPHSYRAQWALAASYRAQGDVAAAQAHYRLSTTIYDRDSKLLTEYAELLLGLARFDEAIALLERAYAAHPDASHTAVLLAHAYLVAGRFDDALSVARRAENIGVARGTASFIRAAAHEGLDDPDAAAAEWRVGILHTDDPSWRMWSFLARALAAGGHTRETEDALGHARELALEDAAERTVEQLGQAIRNGCYTDGFPPATAGEKDDSNACDPLGRWVGLVPSRGPMTSEPGDTIE